jgi:hypothetical protein
MHSFGDLRATPADPACFMNPGRDSWDLQKREPLRPDDGGVSKLPPFRAERPRTLCQIELGSHFILEAPQFFSDLSPLGHSSPSEVPHGTASFVLRFARLHLSYKLLHLLQ